MWFGDGYWVGMGVLKGFYGLLVLGLRVVMLKVLMGWDGFDGLGRVGMVCLSREFNGMVKSYIRSIGYWLCKLN